MESDAVFFMTIGIPGSGKSTIMKTFPQESIVSSDKVREEINGDISDQSNSDIVWDTIFGKVVQLLRTQKLAILDATNTDSELRQNFLDELKTLAGFPIKTVAIVFHVDPEVAKERIAKDIASGKNRANVPEDVVDNMYTQFKSGYSDTQHQFDKVING